MAREPQALTARWTLDKSTLLRNGNPVFTLHGIASGEATPSERKALRRFIVLLLNAAERGAGHPALICDFDEQLPYQ